MATLELPVRSDLKSYEFTIDLEDGTFTLRFKYVERMDLWVMDIADAQNVDIVVGVPVQTNIDLFGQITKSDLPPGTFIALDETGQERDAGQDDLGNDVKLFYVESE